MDILQDKKKTLYGDKNNIYVIKQMVDYVKIMNRAARHVSNKSSKYIYSDLYEIISYICITAGVPDYSSLLIEDSLEILDTLLKHPNDEKLYAIIKMGNCNLVMSRIHDYKRYK